MKKLKTIIYQDISQDKASNYIYLLCTLVLCIIGFNILGGLIFLVFKYGLFNIFEHFPYLYELFNFTMFSFPLPIALTISLYLYKRLRNQNLDYSLKKAFKIMAIVFIVLNIILALISLRFTVTNELRISFDKFIFSNPVSNGLRVFFLLNIILMAVSFFKPKLYYKYLLISFICFELGLYIYDLCTGYFLAKNVEKLSWSLFFSQFNLFAAILFFFFYSLLLAFHEEEKQ